ncbi:MAG: type I-B CRISPR-associated endonuclease Cas1b [Oscillospiraceae bacterium]|jgi:CRISPR-associated protein Cas1|nr:type I-B CRISPR-associated endonuclease Cas1b [Oscillospiraceae bacterium]
MKRSIYIYTNGELHRNDNTLEFIAYDGTKKSLPIAEVSDIYLMTEMNFNTKMLQLISKYGVLIHFFDYYTNYVGTYFPKENLLAGNVLVQQVQAYLDETHRLRLARGFVQGATDNILRNLRYYNNRGLALQETMNAMQIFRDQTDCAANILELMGYEGKIHTLYYSAFEKITGSKAEFKKRVRHPPDNMMNTMLSFINGMIYARCLGEIYRTQLNPTVSFLHEPGIRRFSLSLDISEIFKPLIGDRLLFSLINKNQITEQDFTRELNCLHLKKKASQIIAQALDARLKTTIRHRELKKGVSYQYLMRLECYKLIKDIMGEKLYKPFVIWW